MVVRQTILCRSCGGSLARVASSRPDRVCWRGCDSFLSASLHVASLDPLDLLRLAAGHHCRADFAGWLPLLGSLHA